MNKIISITLGSALIGVVTLIGSNAFTQQNTAKNTLLNVSYDPTRELYQDYNATFIQYWQQKTSTLVTMHTSHGGSGAQARAVSDGLQADIVTLGSALDIDAIATRGLITKNWQSRLPNHSSPYTSTVVFLVRKGNPKKIKNWNDLLQPNLEIITPNPKTSSGARWNFLAAWGYAIQKLGTEANAQQFMTKLYQNVTVLDSGARGSSTTFIERGIGDVLITWENEALLGMRHNANEFELIAPPTSILAETPVTWVDTNTKKHGTTGLAKAYLEYLYSPAGQEIGARNFYRPRNAVIAKKYAAQYPKLKLFTLESLFGSWKAAQKKFFADGGVFDQLYQQDR